MAAYLDAWLSEAPDDAAGIARALGNIARAKGTSQVGRDAGLSRERLYKALGEKGNPSFATILKVAKALGVRLHAEVVEWISVFVGNEANRRMHRTVEGGASLAFSCR